MSCPLSGKLRTGFRQPGKRKAPGSLGSLYMGSRHMVLTLLTLSMSPAMAGYGDVVNDRPNWQQRELLTLTNLVRVDPEA